MYKVFVRWLLIQIVGKPIDIVNLVGGGSFNCYLENSVYFHIKNKQHQRYFQFLSDGKIRDIGGAGHDNERFWKLEDQKLKLYSKSEQLTAVFECCYEEVGHSYWEGLHQETIPLEIRIYDSRPDLFDYLTKYTCRYLIDYGALIVGKHTYGIPQLIDYDHGGQVIIGYNWWLLFYWA